MMSSSDASDPADTKTVIMSTSERTPAQDTVTGTTKHTPSSTTATATITTSGSGSTAPSTAGGSTGLGSSSADTFPEILHAVLCMADNDDDESVSQSIKWNPDGESFRIINRKRFERDVMPRYFSSAGSLPSTTSSRSSTGSPHDGPKYLSFTRKLNRWGYRHLNRGSGAGCFFHPLFLRDKPELCLSMQCQRVRQGLKRRKNKGQQLPPGVAEQIWAHNANEVAAAQQAAAAAGGGPYGPHGPYYGQQLAMGMDFGTMNDVILHQYLHQPMLSSMGLPGTTAPAGGMMSPPVPTMGGGLPPGALPPLDCATSAPSTSAAAAAAEAGVNSLPMSTGLDSREDLVKRTLAHEHDVAGNAAAVNALTTAGIGIPNSTVTISGDMGAHMATPQPPQNMIGGSSAAPPPEAIVALRELLTAQKARLANLEAMLLKYDQRQPLGGGMPPMVPQATEGAALLSGAADPPRPGTSPIVDPVGPVTAMPPSLQSVENGPDPGLDPNATTPSLSVMPPSLPSLPPPLESVGGRDVSEHIPIEDMLSAQLQHHQQHDLGGTKASMEKLDASVSGDGGATTSADTGNEKGKSDEKKPMVESV